MGTTAKASLISNRSTSSRLQPLRASTRWIAVTGALVNRFGAWAWPAWATMRASGLRPRRSASDWRISSRAAAPSEIELELAAVTVPPSRNAGLSVGIFSGLALGGCSSAAIRRRSRPAGASTATISSAKWPASIACCARRSDSKA